MPAHRPLHDPYRELGVPRDATLAEITATYRALVRALHPDAQHGPADPARLADVLAAYAVLRNPRSRADYDRLHPMAPPPSNEEQGPTSIPVRTHPSHPRRQPDIRVGPVRRHDA
jgi:curved DNA-binding protein CbpA